MRTREQEYAVAVLKRVQAVQQQYAQNKEARDQYGSMAHNLPALIRTAGLVQAIVFLETRNSQAQKQLLTDLAEVVYKDRQQVTDKREHFVKRSREAELSEYMLLTQHALAALLWFKRYADSVLDVRAGDVGSGNA